MKHLKKRTKIILGIFALVFAVGTGFATWATFSGKFNSKADTITVSVGGLIYNADGNLQGGATVIMVPLGTNNTGSIQQTTSDSQGHWLISNIPISGDPIMYDTSYDLIASYGCQNKIESFSLSSQSLDDGSQLDGKNITLERKNLIGGIVKDSSSGAPIPNVDLVISGTGESMVTDYKGVYFKLLDSSITLGQLTVSASGYITAFVPFNISSCVLILPISLSKAYDHGHLDGYFWLNGTPNPGATPPFRGGSPIRRSELDTGKYHISCSAGNWSLPNPAPYMGEGGSYFISDIEAIPVGEWSVTCALSGAATATLTQPVKIQRDQGTNVDWNFQAPTPTPTATATPTPTPTPTPTASGVSTLQYVYGNATINYVLPYLSSVYPPIYFINKTNGQIAASLYSSNGLYNQVLNPGSYVVKINNSVLTSFNLAAGEAKPLDININYSGQ